MGHLRVSSFCPGCGQIRPAGDFGWKDVPGGALHDRCRACRTSELTSSAYCPCGTDDPDILIPMDERGRPVARRDEVDHHLCLRCLSGRVGGTV